MAASLLASFFVFVITAAYDIVTYGLKITEDPPTNYLCSLAILSNAAYYCYFAAFTEMDSTFREKLQATPILEWWIRVVNQAILLSLYFWLRFGLIHFMIALSIIYLSYILWNISIWNIKEMGLFLLDIAGFLITLCLIYLNFNMNTSHPDLAAILRYHSFVGMMTTFYLLFALVGIVIGVGVYGFNPFKKEYLKRPGAH